MMVQVHNNLHVGDKYSLLEIPGEWDIISLSCVPQMRTNHLIIDMVDASSPKYFHIEQFNTIPSWINPMTPTFIHCDQGISRAPSVAMYYMAFMGNISDTSYYSAYAEFKSLYPSFSPGSGIREFMAEWWSGLMKP